MDFKNGWLTFSLLHRLEDKLSWQTTAFQPISLQNISFYIHISLHTYNPIIFLYFLNFSFLTPIVMQMPISSSFVAMAIYATEVTNNFIT